MQKLLASLCLLIAAGTASAAMPAFDPSTAVTYLENNAGAGIASIGLAMVTLAGLAVAIKWIKATFFG